MLFALATAALVGLDMWISYRRMQQYGALVELNPISRQLALDYGPKAGVAVLGTLNAGILFSLLHFHLPTLLHIFFGAKLGLATMQLKSLLIERKLNSLIRKL